MASISFSKFKRILYALNPKIRVFESMSTRSSMIYLDNGNHDLANEQGLREICGYPSPCYNISFPKYDFIDNAGLLGRGYTTVFKILCMKKHINKDRLRALLPHALDPTRHRPEVIRHEEKQLIPVYANAPTDTGRKLVYRKRSNKH